MASSKPLAALLLAVALAATAMSAADQVPAPPACQPNRKVTVQNLCGKDLYLDIEPLANSKLLYSPGHLLRHGTHETYNVCAWTGRVKVKAPVTAALTEFHIGFDGGAWYQVDTNQASMGIRVS